MLPPIPAPFEEDSKAAKLLEDQLRIFFAPDSYYEDLKMDMPLIAKYVQKFCDLCAKRGCKNIMQTVLAKSVGESGFKWEQ